MREASVEAGVLSVAYREYGPADGWPCIMGHGFPYDVHAYAEVGPALRTTVSELERILGQIPGGPRGDL